MRVDDQDTQEALLDRFLLSLQSLVAAFPAPELADAPLEVLVRSPRASHPREHLFAMHVHNMTVMNAKYMECYDEMYSHV
jgi:hypothetical protein